MHIGAKEMNPLTRSREKEKASREKERKARKKEKARKARIQVVKVLKLMLPRLSNPFLLLPFLTLPVQLFLSTIPGTRTHGGREKIMDGQEIHGGQENMKPLKWVSGCHRIGTDLKFQVSLSNVLHLALFPQHLFSKPLLVLTL